MPILLPRPTLSFHLPAQMEATSPEPVIRTSGSKSPVLRRRHSLRKTVQGWKEDNCHPSPQRPSLSWDDHPYYARLSAGNAVVDFYDDLSQRLYFPDASNDTTPDDPMTVIDESFFFLDYLAGPSVTPTMPSSGPCTSNPPSSASTRPTNYRVSFTTLLTNCHDHRMSTISEATQTPTESPFPLPPSSPTNTKGKGLDPPVADPSAVSASNNNSPSTTPIAPRHPKRSAPSKNKHRHQSPSYQKERNGLQKLLDYIKPYPTRTVNRTRRSTHNGKPRLRPIAPYRPPPVLGETRSDRTSLAETDEADEEWVLHGFFEIRSLSLSRID